MLISKTNTDGNAIKGRRVVAGYSDVVTMRSLLVALSLFATAFSSVAAAPTDTSSKPKYPPISDVFITRKGSVLYAGKERYAAVGSNGYWLGLDENDPPKTIAYPAKSRLTEFMATVKAMGGNTIRAQTLGISVGNPLSVEPTLNNFNENAFEAIDWALYAGKVYGLKFVVPLVDNYNYYLGGRFTFTEWRGIPDSANETFYTNPTVINDYKNYIAHLLSHKNKYTGLAYKDDPVIMAWETGSELAYGAFGNKNVPTNWTDTIAKHIKSLAPKHLVMDGTYGIQPAALTLDSVDLYSDHFYPRNVSKLEEDLALVSKAGKAFYAGEYDSTLTGTSGNGDSLPTWLSAIENAYAQKNGLIGDAFWSLFGHTANCSAYVQHGDGFTVHYPGDDANMVQAVKDFTAHGYKMQGLTPPKKQPQNLCPQPKLPGQ